MAVAADEGNKVTAGDLLVRLDTSQPQALVSTGGRAIKIAFDEPVDLPVGLTVNAAVASTSLVPWSEQTHL